MYMCDKQMHFNVIKIADFFTLLVKSFTFYHELDISTCFATFSHFNSH